MARRLFYGGAGLLLCLVATWLVLNRQLLIDRWQLRHYQPEAGVAALAERLDLTDYGQRLFYVKNPKLQTAQDFNRVCPEGESSFVLGCYNGHQIYIFVVDDQRLDGVEEVTAAHELLHVAYERLGSRPKTTLKIWLKAVRDGLSNQRIKKAVELYDGLDDDQLYNELHSIFATEIRDLPDWLDDYYARYFNSRLEIVAFSEAYDATFAQLEDQLAEFDQELATRANQIETIQTGLDVLLETISQDRTRLDQLLADRAVVAYNAGLDDYNQLVSRYLEGRTELLAEISDHNRLIESRNNLSLEQNDLLESLNSRHQAPVQELGL